jgi:hypothetical protein
MSASRNLAPTLSTQTCRMNDELTLIVVAHPDDEVLWFSSILSRRRCEVICVTSGRDADDTRERRAAFSECMKAYNVSRYWFLQHLDGPGRLDVERLILDLLPWSLRDYAAVYTHGPFGEFHEHKHHQDVCYAVHQAFDRVVSISWNAFPTIVNKLSLEEFEKKRRSLGTTYHVEYRNIKTMYPISAVEAFARFPKAAVEGFYWGFANSGDHHQRLGRKSEDFRGFRSSEYELERHAAIARLAAMVRPAAILEYGSCEGILTRQLMAIAPVSCVEKAPAYRDRLAAQGFAVVDMPDPARYDLAVVASLLEYLEAPEQFLKAMRSDFLLVEVIVNSRLDRTLRDILRDYELIEETVITPRWDALQWGDNSDQLPSVYRPGAHIYLLRKRALSQMQGAA